MVDIATANKGELRAAMRAAELPYEGLNVEGMRAALTAHAEELAARIVTEELPSPDGMGPQAVELEQPLPVEQPAPVEVLPVVEQPAPVVPAPVARPARAESFGVKQPAPGTICRQIWDYCDAVRATGVMPQAKALRGWGAGRLDDVTMTVQFYRWRKFNGIGGRQA